MRRLVATAFAAILMLSFAGPVAAVTASLSVLQIVPDDPGPCAGECGSITFQSDPYKGKPDRIVVWRCTGEFSHQGSSPSIDKRTGQSDKIYFATGYYQGTLVCQNWTAWVALVADWQTPISPVLSGSF